MRGVAVLKLEAIGDDQVQAVRQFAGFCEMLGFDAARPTRGMRRPWVAELTGSHPKFRFRRRFLDGQKNFSEANSVGSRGVYVYYHLEPGKVYEVNDLRTWTKTDRYFCRVEDGRVVRMDELEVRRALLGLKDAWSEPDF